MAYLQEYISKKMTILDAEKELTKLLQEYFMKTNKEILLYYSDSSTGVPDCVLSQKDYFMIKDLLDDSKEKNLSIFLVTPGGRGETAEEIVKYTRKKFDRVDFIICGEAKSAGTILAMSGDEIMMTDSGSLGPIDAQMMIGRSNISAHDYTEWIEEKRKESLKNGFLNPVDMTILAQITPGELRGAVKSQEYAVEMVKEWLEKYKFKNWLKTETHNKVVTKKMREERAEEIAKLLNDHGKWKTHGRSLKKEDLEKIKLKIFDIEKDSFLKEISYRIHAICRFIFLISPTYKIIATRKNKISFTASQIPVPNANPTIPDNVTALEIDHGCEKCGKVHKLYLKLIDDNGVDIEMIKKGRIKFPTDGNLRCECGYETNLTPFRNDLESRINKKTYI